MLPRKPSKPHPGHKEEQPAHSPWRAVGVLPGAHCCAVVQAMSERRWLYADAPRLPLPGCDAARCDCRYKHYPDRRVNDRRRIDRTGLPRQHNGLEQRSPRRGRRWTD
jgi:hypothetical protein